MLRTGGYGLKRRSYDPAAPGKRAPGEGDGADERLA